MGLGVDSGGPSEGVAEGRAVARIVAVGSVGSVGDGSVVQAARSSSAMDGVRYRFERLYMIRVGRSCGEGIGPILASTAISGVGGRGTGRNGDAPGLASSPRALGRNQPVPCVVNRWRAIRLSGKSRVRDSIEGAPSSVVGVNPT